jgi:hypothetical protein
VPAEANTRRLSRALHAEKKSRAEQRTIFFARRKVAFAVQQRSHAAVRGAVLEDVRVFASKRQSAQCAAGSTHARRDCP